MRFVLVHSHLARRAHTDRIGASKARTCADPDSPLWIDSPLHAASLTPSLLHSLVARRSPTAAALSGTLSLAHRSLARSTCTTPASHRAGTRAELPVPVQVVQTATVPEESYL